MVVAIDSLTVTVTIMTRGSNSSTSKDMNQRQTQNQDIAEIESEILHHLCTIADHHFAKNTPELFCC